MARSDLRNHLDNQVQKSIKLGANCLLGGSSPDRKGYYYLPTLLEYVNEKMPAFKEELFGPVMVLAKAGNEKEALEMANNTEFGLGSAVFTADVEKGEKIARDSLVAGSAFVNTFVRSDPRLPFGGINSSGYGRELSIFGIHEFVNIKSVYIN